MELINDLLSYSGLGFGVAMVMMMGAIGGTLLILARNLKCSVTEAADAVATVLNALRRKGGPRQSGRNN